MERIGVLINKIEYIIFCDEENIRKKLSDERKWYLKARYTEPMGKRESYYSERNYFKNIDKISDTLSNLLSENSLKNMLISKMDDNTNKICKKTVLFWEYNMNALYLEKNKLWILSIMRMVPIDEKTFRIEYINTIKYS
ncbi:hypothetical protein J3A84_05535 [Proteiniclasticum sp. SCR006]|uniref:Uncharacterized protein n=1 Tax=Proteiniclasticum aestuarii TaxID=2817862 RepID=A0A939H7D4_9CLOT|nr:hypothetical protein [Proteiniclasticum aestuarii]MBO1264501.1 hypothetical protein [Proteiniclasticum aestuarii]